MDGGRDEHIYTGLFKSTRLGSFRPALVFHSRQLIGVIGALVFSQIIVKKGSRFVAAIGLIAQGVISIWFGNIQSVASYAIAISALNFFVSGFGYVVPGTLMNVWFPRKKRVGTRLGNDGDGAMHGYIRSPDFNVV